MSSGAAGRQQGYAQLLSRDATADDEEEGVTRGKRSAAATAAVRSPLPVGHAPVVLGVGQGGCSPRRSECRCARSVGQPRPRAFEQQQPEPPEPVADEEQGGRLSQLQPFVRQLEFPANEGLGLPLGERDERRGRLGAHSGPTALLTAACFDGRRRVITAHTDWGSGVLRGDCERLSATGRRHLLIARSLDDGGAGPRILDCDHHACGMAAGSGVVASSSNLQLAQPSVVSCCTASAASTAAWAETTVATVFEDGSIVVMRGDQVIKRGKLPPHSTRGPVSIQKEKEGGKEEVIAADSLFVANGEILLVSVHKGKNSGVFAWRYSKVSEPPHQIDGLPACDWCHASEEVILTAKVGNPVKVWRVNTALTAASKCLELGDDQARHDRVCCADINRSTSGRVLCLLGHGGDVPLTKGAQRDSWKERKKQLILWSFSVASQEELDRSSLEEEKVPTVLTPEMEISGHASGVSCCRFIQDDASSLMGPTEQCVTGGFDGELFIWSLRTGMQLHRLVGHRTRLLLCALIRSDKGVTTLSSASADGDVRIWNIDRSECAAVSVDVDSEPNEVQKERHRQYFTADTYAFRLPREKETYEHLLRGLDTIDKGTFSALKSLSQGVEKALQSQKEDLFNDSLGLLALLMEATVLVLKGTENLEPFSDHADVISWKSRRLKSSVSLPWKVVMKEFNEPDKIMGEILSMDKDNVSTKTIDALRNYLDLPDFSPERMNRFSGALTGLCKWICAVDRYCAIRNLPPDRELPAEPADGVNALRNCGTAGEYFVGVRTGILCWWQLTDIDPQDAQTVEGLLAVPTLDRPGVTKHGDRTSE
eukprot:COSAG01_NODE_3000_length_6737_cov_23.402079_3_plen_824_part_00